MALVFVLFIFTAFQLLITAGQDDVGRTTTAAGDVVCKKDPNGSQFIPNIYTCNTTQFCCTNAGVPACCSNEVTNDSIKEQAVMWAVIIGVILLFGLAASCYFKDRYCCDGDPDEDDRHVCCCCCRRKIHYKKKMSFQSIFFPHITAKNKVADPIFGEQEKSDEVPHYATLHPDTEAKYVVRETV